MGRAKIQDEFTDLKVSRQRKEQLRHPEAHRLRQIAWAATEKAKSYQREYQRKYRDNKKMVDKAKEV